MFLSRVQHWPCYLVFFYLVSFAFVGSIWCGSTRWKRRRASTCCSTSSSTTTPSTSTVPKSTSVLWKQKKNNSVKPSKPCPSFNSMQQKLGKKILRPVKLNEIVCTCYWNVQLSGTSLIVWLTHQLIQSSLNKTQSTALKSISTNENPRINTYKSVNAVNITTTRWEPLQSH